MRGIEVDLRLPSPLQELHDERLGGVRVLLKRDDMIHPELTGNEEPQVEWPFAVELAAMPEVWRALLELHVSGRDGRCRGCHSQVRMAPRWPCPLYGAAAQARRIAASIAPTNGTFVG